jgi:hypothetical protein
LGASHATPSRAVGVKVIQKSIPVTLDTGLAGMESFFIAMSFCYFQ